MSWQDFRVEEPEWEEGGGRLSSLIGARVGLMRGDRRGLYLGWLAQAWAGSVDEASPEPPVPPGLGELDATLRALADFLRVSEDLLAAASESSAPLQASRMGWAEIARWVAERSGAEKDALLTELLADERPQRLAVLRSCGSGSSASSIRSIPRPPRVRAGR